METGDFSPFISDADDPVHSSACVSTQMRKSPVREQDGSFCGRVPVRNSVGPKQEQGMFANGSRFFSYSSYTGTIMCAHLRMGRIFEHHLRTGSPIEPVCKWALTR